ncbi:MAG: A24 family peptidase [Paenibacillaceae bacterium]
MIQWSLIGLLTSVAFFTDIRHCKIPNWLTMSGLCLGLIYHGLKAGLEGLLFSVFGMIFGLVLLFILYVFGAIGAGDVKLFAAYGAIAGIQFVTHSLVYAVLYAGFIGIAILIIQKKLLQRLFWVFSALFSFFIMKELFIFQNIPQNQMLRFPFMWAVLPAILTYGIRMKGVI